jgi:M6 family metalloprotease-like protein
MSALHGEIVVCGQHVGGDIELRIFGDEFYARHETLSGYTVVYDKTLGRYCYATLAGGHFVSSGVPVNKPIPAGLRKHLKEEPQVRNDKFDQRYEQLRPAEGITGSSATRTLGPENGLLSGRTLHKGRVRGLTILVDFKDVTSSIKREDVEEMLNGDDYTVNGNFSSVKKYYETISAGKFTYENTVVGPVKLKHRRSYYIDNLLVEEAINAAIDEFHVDLSEFDSKNEGVVDAINILYAGRSEYNGDLWPHNHTIRLKYGNIRTHYYMITGLGQNKVDLRIGTICHENGHMLCRFPDMYDYGKRDGDSEKSQGMGSYCLMSSGNHLNQQRTPSPVCAYLRDLAGWTENEITLNNQGRYKAVHGDYGTVMKYRTNHSNEYFIIENRSNRGLDTYLPSGGLAIYHCDILGSNELQEGTRERHYQCALLQADGHLDLEHNGNRGDSGDLFKAIEGIAVSDMTHPSSRQWDGTDSGLLISDITEPSEIISFTVGKPAKPAVIVESFPDLAIPDDTHDGVNSVLNVDGEGKVSKITLTLDITHTWISDLRVSLTAPDGTSVVVHDLEGEDGDDIKASYSSDDLLPSMLNKPIKGDWTLNIVDTVESDVGKLNSWKLEMEYEFDADITEAESTPDLAIPDSNSDGVTDVISIDDIGTLGSIVVKVDIQHTYIGDLQVDLISPAGSLVRLHNQEGDNQDSLVSTYDIDSTPDLGVLTDEQIEGEWLLKVRDLTPEDTGIIKKWSLKIVRTVSG